MDVGVIGDVALTLGPQPLDQLGREVVALALFLVAAETDDVGVVGIDDQLTIFKLGQPGEIVLGGVTVWCHAHDLELAVEHLEAEVFGDRAIQATERIRVVELLDLVDLAILTPTEEGGCVLTLAVDPQDRRFLSEAGAVISTGGVGQVVLNRLKTDFFGIEAQLLQTPKNLIAITLEAAVSGQDGIERTIRRVPVTLGVMPAGLTAKQADRGKGDTDDIHVCRLNAGLLKTEFGRLVGHTVLGVLVAYKALFFYRSNQLAVDIECGGGVVTQCAGKAQYGKSHGSPLLSIKK